MGRNMTVDEILATGQYRDRRGREWKRGPSFVCNRDWFYLNGIYKGGYANDTEMRLLIERDSHRDECPGLYNCMNHPVPIVWYGDISEGWCVDLGNWHSSLPEAMDAARAWAVGG